MIHEEVSVVPVLIQEYTHTIQTPDGVNYRVLACGEARIDGHWEGWLQFEPDADRCQRLTTGRETTQPDLAALIYWASGLEPVYLEGAYKRAIPTVS